MEEGKVTFTPEQQAKLQEIVDGVTARNAKERDTITARAAADAAELKSQLEALKAQVESAGKSTAANTDAEARMAELERVAAEQKRNSETLAAQLRSKDDVIAATKAEAMKIRKDSATMAAASKVGFVDVSEAVALTERSVKWDEDRGTFVVLNERGVERLNSSYEPMSLEEYYAEFAAKRPHLVRADVRGGAGGTESAALSHDGKVQLNKVFGKGSSAAEALALKRKNPAEYARMRQEAVRLGMI